MVPAIAGYAAQQQEFELTNAEQVAREAIAAPEERERQERRAHLRLVKSDMQTQTDAGNASNAPAERD